MKNYLLSGISVLLVGAVFAFSSNSNVISKLFTSESSQAPSELSYSSSMLVNCPPATADPYIGGNVFKDIDMDGQNDANIDQAVSNALITMFNSDGRQVGTTTSESDETYLYAASFRKRHTDMSPLGEGDIYRLDYSGGAAANLNWTGTGADTEVLPEMTYTMSTPNVLGADQQAGFNGYESTITDLNPNGTNKTDSEAVINGNDAEFTIKTGNNGEVKNESNIGFKSMMNCELAIASTSVSGCTDNGDGTYSATLDVTVSWNESPDPAEDIIVSVNGANAQNITTTAASTGSQTVQFTINADGNNVDVDAEFATTSICAVSTTAKSSLPCVADVTPDCATGIAGQAYLDNNENGANDDAGTGVAGVQVLAYDCDNNLIGSTYTDADGEYQIPNTNSTDEYRIEFVISDAIACDAKPTFAGGTTVQFGTAGTCYDLGFLDLTATEIPDIVFGTPNADGKLVIAGTAAVSCGVINSMPQAAKFSFGLIDVRTIAYAANRPQVSPADIHHPSWHVDQIGNVFGIDFDADRNIYVTASTHYGYGFFGNQSVIKFGTLGGGEEDLGAAGTIYKLDASTGQASVFAQLPQQAAAFGHGDCESGLNLNRNTGPALGNIAFDKYHNQLFVSNFEDGKIYRLDLSGNILNSFDPFVADNGAAGFSTDKNPYGLALSPDGSKLFFGTHELNLAPGLYSVDLTAAGDFTGSEFFHTSFSGNGQIGGGFTSAPWVCISDIEFRPDGQLIAAIRTGCEANFATSHNHGGTYYILEDSDSDGMVDDIIDNPRIHYPNDPYGPDDGYGGVGVFDKQDGTYDYVVSNADIRNEAGPHGVMVFPENYTTTGTGGQYILQPTAAIPYYAPLSGADLKGWGGDVQVFSGQDQVVYPIEIGNYIWFDINQNGLQDACEEGIDGVTVNMYDATTCTLVATTTTANGGSYTFNDANVTGGIQPNVDYIITTGDGQYDNTTGVMTVAGTEYYVTTQNAGSNDFIDSDASAGVACGSLPNLPFVAFTTEMNGCHSHDIDFGFSPTCVTVGLTFQQNENNVSAICIGESVDIKITHSPSPGDMAIYEGPAGLSVAQLYDFANHGANGITAVNAALSPASSSATMTSETGLAPTSETTYYAILANGNTFINDPDCLPFSEMTLPVFTQTPTAVIPTDPQDLCSEDSPYMTGTDNVVDLQSYITSGDTGGTWASTDAPAGSLVGSIFTATTAMEGTTYNFTYTIAGMTTMPGLCDDNVYNLQIAVNDCYAAIGNFVWEDTNGNGVQDETGTEVENIKVILFESASGVKGDMVAMAETDANGEYFFDLLVPGEYAVQFDLANSTNTDAADFIITGQNSTVATATAANNSDANPTDGCTAGYVLAAGDENLTVDAGLIKLASIGNFVWEDTNANGIQDETGTGIENVSVTLTGTDGLGNAVSETINTAADGSYLFEDLVPGDYQLTFGTPTDFTPTAANDPSTNGAGDDSDDSDANATTGMTVVTALESGENDDTWDAGFFESASIGNFVWEDTNANGIQDETGTGIENVSVTLTGTNGLGNAVSTTTNTAADGSYLFDNLVPGDYQLTFGTPTDFTPTAVNDPSSNGAGDDSDDSDVDVATGMTTVTNLESGEDDLTWDAGFYETASLGNYVWEDTNADGVQDEVNTGIENVSVNLNGTDGLGNTVTASTTTAADGSYLFDNLVPGDYNVTFSTPTGYVQTGANDPSTNGAGTDADDSDASLTDGMTTVTNLESGEDDLTWDAGFYQLASISNLVFEDTDANGVQNGTEPGIEGATVMLTGTDGLGNSVSETLTTNPDGTYIFDDLVPGEYELTFSTPTGYEPTGTNDPSTNGAGTDADDSDASTTDGTTGTTILVSNEDDDSWDAGFYELASIGNYVWVDTNADGVQDEVATGIEGVLVTLNGTDGLGNTVTATTNTIADGSYIFEDLVPGDYNLTFGTPTGYEATGQDDASNNGLGDDTDDSDASIADGSTVVTTLTSGEYDPTWDAGFYETSSISNLVFEDTNANGIQDAGELGIEGATVTLTGTDGLGNPVSETLTTNPDGTYIFDDLSPGDYNLTFTTPTGYTPTGANDPSTNGAGTDADDSDASITDGMTTVTTLESGENDDTWDAGFYELASIGNFVWEDLNGNGIQDETGTGISNFPVTLTGQDGLGNPVSANTTTAFNGSYIFEDLVPGDYKITFNAPANYSATLYNDQNGVGAGDDTDDSDANPTMGNMTTVTTLVSGEYDPTWDAGFYQTASIGNYVWEDTNADGIQDEFGTGIEGVEVTLLGTDMFGNFVNSTMSTDANGAYLFDNLVPGDYKVTFAQPAGYEPTGLNDSSSNGAGNDNDDSDADPTNGLMTTVTNLESGENDPSWDAGFYQLASISNLVFEDTDADGTQDATEPGIEGATVTLTGTDGLGNPVSETTTTIADGTYIFDDLVPGDYELTFSTPTGYEPTGTNDPSSNGLGDNTDDSDASITDGTTGSITLVSGEDDDSWDAGFYETASLGNYVWEDTNADGVQDETNTGIEGVSVVLNGTDGLGNTVSETTTTAADGSYLFEDLVPGDYNVSFATPTGFEPTATDDPSTNGAGADADDSDASTTDGMTVVTTLISGEEDLTWDAGFYQNASLGNYVWEDTNADGVQDETNTGIAGVEVTLTGTDGLGNTVSETTNTATDGSYLFDDLVPGDYNVTFGTPAGYVQTGANDPSTNGAGADADDSDASLTDGMTTVTTLVSGENDPTWDAGFYQLASLSNLVFEDTNADGAQTAGEPGIEGATVTLTGTDGLGNPVSETTTTITDGTYIFDDLVPGDYELTFTTPTGYEPTGTNDPSTNGAGDDSDDSDASTTDGTTGTTTLVSNEDDDSWDAGFYELASIGNYVWIDTNADGVQDEVGTGIEGVEVTLNGTDGLGNTVTATTNTIADGSYIFEDLVPGDYNLTFVKPTGHLPTGQDDGSNNGLGDDTDDSDADLIDGSTAVTTLTSGEYDPTWDAGFFEAASISNLVFEDTNANGVQDTNEPGIEGVTVTLTGTDGLGNPVSETTTTQPDGSYIFEDLVPGDYNLTFETPTGYESTAANDPSTYGTGADTDDSDASTTDGMTTVTSLESGEDDDTWDAGFYELASIGNYVWEDTNGNGIQDETNTGIEGVLVTLNGTDGLGNAVTATTNTGTDGSYIFEDLVPGDYNLTFEEPTDFDPTIVNDVNGNGAGDDSDDSDASLADGTTTVTTLVSGEDDLTWDAGYYQTAGLGNYVWIDTNANGIQDEANTGIEGILVTLNGTDLFGDEVTATTNTLADGSYTFEGLIPGDYNVTFATPTGYEPTGANDPSTNGAGADADDSDASIADGTTEVTTLTSGEYDPTWDAGFYEYASISNLVFEDTDANGVQDTNEPGIEGATVTLEGTDGLGNPVTATTTTGIDGTYIFEDLVPGEYELTFETPTDYLATGTNDPSGNGLGDDTDDSDASTTDGTTGTTILVSGEDDDSWDAGFFEAASIGDYVWEDTNADGVQDEVNTGIEGVEVTLTGTDGLGNAVTATTTTSVDGSYIFEDLVPGDYNVTFAAGAEYIPTGADDASNNGAGTDTDDSDANIINGMTIATNLESGEYDPTWDAGFYQYASLSNTVFEDTDANGVQNGTESGIEGVTITLEGTDGLGNPVTATTTTGVDGTYIFEDLVPGEYELTFETPTDYEATAANDPSGNGTGDDTDDSDASTTDGTTGTTILVSNEDDDSWDAGFYEYASIGDYVWTDTNADGVQDEVNTGIEGVLVTLNGTDGLGNAVTATTNTGVDGAYIFEDLVPGDYNLTFGTPTGYEPTGANDPSTNGAGADADDSDASIADGTTEVTTLISGEYDPTWDAGFYEFASLSNLVFEDTDANGVQDAGEPGIGGVTVIIEGTDGLGNPVTATTTTNPDGTFVFEDLVPGEYELIFDTPTGYIPTGTNDPSGNGAGDDTDDSDASIVDGTTGTTILVSGEDDDTYDAGYFESASIGNLVFEDFNDNGAQDAGETGIEGVTVELTGTDGLGNPVTATTTTAADGTYIFDDLVPGEYNLTFTVPTDMQSSDLDATTPLGDDSDDSDADPANNWMTVVTVLISAEDDDTWDAGFYATDFGDNPDSFGTVVASNGAVHVINPGKYLGAGVDAELDGSATAQAEGDDNDASTYNEGTVDASGNDDDGIVFNTPLIAGHEACITATATVSGNAPAYLTGWIDFNGDGTFSADEQLQFTAGTDALIATGTTEYCFEVPANATFEGGETHARFRLSCETGVQPTGQIIGGEVEDYYIPLMKVGNLVWQDVDNEGDQDELAEYGLNDVIVHLTWAGEDNTIGTTDDVIFIDTTATENGVDGKYCFIGVTPGNYEISIPEYPTNFQQAPIDATGNDMTDNDGDNYQFTIVSATNQPTGENSTGDEPGNVFPDNQDDLTIDIALVAFDYGDLPDDFATTVGNDGAHHVLEPGLFLGTIVDAEMDGNPDADAGVEGGGDNDNGAEDPITGAVPSDEEGIEFLTPFIPGNPACIRVNGAIPSGEAYFKAWIDFNGDGDFVDDANEELVFTQADATAITPTNEMTYSAGTISQKLTFMVPADATFDGGETHFRFRFGREQAVSFTGEANGGEVEDYWRPLAKIGNLVWREYDEEGDQDEAVTLGLDGVQVNLIYEGEDATIGTADDITYTTFTAPENGVNGKYAFCGLTAGNYQVVLPTVPGDMIVSPTNAIGNPILDADPLTVDVFIEDPQGLFPFENGTGDNAPSTFPTENDLLVIDFGFSAVDFGDLPLSFANTTDADNGAYHVINPSLYLGQGVDSETDGKPQYEAGTQSTGGDDQTVSTIQEGAVAPTGSDEDGIEFISPIIPGEKAYVRVTTHAAANPAVLNAWVDFDGDGTFAADGSEQVQWTGTDAATYAATSEGIIAQGDNTQIMCFEVPETAIFEGGETHVRMRLSTDGGLSPNDKAVDGEVEDYYLEMAKVGNLVWRDLNFNGQQDSEDFGINGITVILTTEGPDGILGTADDFQYETVTAADANGQGGTYQFCGLIAGDYTVSSVGDGSEPTDNDGNGIPDDADSDGITVAFTIDPEIDNQPTGENGIADNPNGSSFPDEHNDLTIDIGYLGMDFGDLPATFPTLLADDGARHVIIQDMYLGDYIDLDIEGVPTDFAQGDNDTPGVYSIGVAATAGDDEEGIQFITPMIPGEKATIAVKHTSTVGAAFLNAWIDWNGDGIFAADGSEALEWTDVNDTPVTPTKNGLLPTGNAINQEFCFNVPTNANFEGGETHIRVRMSAEGDLGFNGVAMSGEVEDYYLPVAKAGNVVWFDADLRGDENEASANGINDFAVELVYAGKDGVLNTTDDIIYTQTTATINGQDGSYYFTGLIDGAYRVQYSEYPMGMISTVFDNTGDDFNDSDADFDFVTFDIVDGAKTNVLNENQVGDDTAPDNFPDIQKNYSIDFGFVNMPSIAASLSLQGVAEPTSEQCGSINAIYQTCITNNGDEPLENIQAVLDFSAANMFGSAYVALAEAPFILSDVTQETPAFNPAFTGNTAGSNLFDGNSGLLFPGDEICVQFTVELRPVDESAPANMQIQGAVSGGAVNFDGTPIPDVLNGNPQFIAEDLSDDGTIANSTNPDSPVDTGGADDPSFFGTCFDEGVLACNDLVQVSVDDMCSAGLTPDMVLENLDPNCDVDALPLGSWYTITLMDQLGNPVPNNEVSADMYGEPMSVKVRHILNCNECWGQVIVEDKDAPEFDCPTDPIIVDCTADLNAIAAPIAIDNCNTNGVTVTLVNESTNDDDVCTSVTITREYTAIDEQGNQTETNCIQTIEIQPMDAVDFPDDINWTCEQYAANPNITDATQAGSGIPNVSEGTYCNFGVSSNDEIVSICSSTNTFKIIRTWTVLNWCTNSLVTTDINGDDNIQIIKILDDVAPVITAENVAVSANIAGVHPQPCLSTGALPAASITDNCSGVASVEIHTPIGTIFGNGGNIPEPGLGIGTHNVTYVATDGCGNTSELTVQVTVADDYTPTPICEEITQVAIGGDGIATVAAETFDDGSNDNCGIDYFEVRRMTDNCAIAGNTTFGESVQFCCADIEATDIMVEFRVVDYYGNANTCMVQVLVEDKLAPIKLNNPADEAIDCDDYFVNIAPALEVATANNEANPQILIDLFGEAIYDDNCEAIVTTNFIVNVNTCGQGTITRTWAATDPSGNIGQSCTQIINVNHVNDWNVQFPANVDLSCEAGQDELDGQDFGEPTIFDDDCELMAMSSEDQVFDVVEGACYEMIRTWTVINWCAYDGDNQDDDTVIGTRRLRDGDDGIVTYQQQIRVTDEVAPVISNPGTQFHCIDTQTDADGDCDMNIQLDEATVTDCSDDVTVTYAVTDLGTGRNYTNVAPGIYDVTVTATDGCGNQSTITYDLDVRDCKAPTPYCVANLVIELMPTDEDGDGIPDAGMVEAWANDFNAGSFDNCTAAENLVYTATIGEDNFDASSSNLLFDCTTTGIQSIYVYVTDEAGNTDYCLTTVMIESVDNVCPQDPTPSDPIIAGAIMTEEGNGVELTEVHVNGATNSMNMTNEAGQHTTTVMHNGDYTVSPLRDDDHDNGVTTFDLVLIRQHVLNTNLLGSPYKLIAADANNSGTVTTSDIVLLRQLILTMIDELPTNTSWRFVDAAYEFENPTNPWATQFPEITNYNNVDADILDANFVGIKIGDVNGTAQANLTQDAEERGTGEVIFRTQDADLIAGEEYSISLATVKELVGAQFTLDFDTDVLEFVALEEEMNAENFGLTKLERGAITVSVNDRQPTTVNCQLIFKALKDSKLSEVLNISSRFTKAEAYDTDDNLLDISLEFGTEENPTFVLLQNTPNPWSEKTTIGFNLPTATRAEIRIHDASGKTLRVIEQSFETGYNEVTLDGKGLGTQSVLFYTITTDKYSATKSMVRVR